MCRLVGNVTRKHCCDTRRGTCVLHACIQSIQHAREYACRAPLENLSYYEWRSVINSRIFCYFLYHRVILALKRLHLTHNIPYLGSLPAKKRRPRFYTLGRPMLEQDNSPRAHTLRTRWSSQVPRRQGFDHSLCTTYYIYMVVINTTHHGVS